MNKSYKLSKIKSIKKISIEQDCYDLTVSDFSRYFANGILVHNCSEISLVTNKDRSFVCCLSSVNLEYYDENQDYSEQEEATENNSQEETTS